MPDKTQTENPSNAFTRMLSEFRDGETLAELSDSLQQLVAAVRETNTAGKLVFTLKVTPRGTANVEITDDITLKAPKLPRENAIFFVTEDNTLCRDNPQQRTFDLRTVEKPQVEVREVKAAANQ